MMPNRLLGKLRIIGGKWRGKKFDVPPLPNVRPTPNRIRETLFNWLAPFIVDTRCLDLFAGSGALGLEALSRGAREVMFIDQSSLVVKHIKNTLLPIMARELQTEAIHFKKGQSSVTQANVLAYLSQPPAQPFDIIFLDPPFHQNLIQPCCALLHQNGWLTADAYIYLETEAELNILPLLPERWELRRSKKAGQVGYHLLMLHAP
ncbi:MAG: 16S rRNA (guanine(966)-N(2))-methyltransferase RsmD [Gammaproteobacteria bacterium]